MKSSIQFVRKESDTIENENEILFNDLLMQGLMESYYMT
jgi:hypothetical protein